MVRSLNVLAIVLLLGACGGGGSKKGASPGDGGPLGSRPDASGPAIGSACPGPLACPKACRTPADCEPGQECNAGLCANPLPSLKSYVLCQLDLDCPTGDGCNAGVCSHDCVSDRDCEKGQLCDVRGRCAKTMAQAGAPAPLAPPTPASPALAVSASSLEVADVGKSATFTIKNDGGGSLEYRIVADRDWIDAQPTTGRLLGGRVQPISVKIAPAGVGAGDAKLTVVSNAGTSTVSLDLPVTLAGHYAGEVSLESPAALGSRTLSLHVTQDSGGKLTGVVDPEGSIAFPFAAPLAPTSALTNDKVELGFVIPAPAGDVSNPFFGRPLRRTVRIVGTFSKAGRISGTFEETIEGALEKPVVVKGQALLTRLGPASTSLTPQAKTVTLAEPAAPSGACDVCPSGAPCPAGDLEAGRAFLDAAFPFYKFDPASWYKEIQGCIANQGTCVNRGALQCAQVRFHKALASDPNGTCDVGGYAVADCARRGLLDSIRGLVDWHMLAGTEKLVRANDLANLGLRDRERQFDDAATIFRQGLRPDDDRTQGRAPFDPFMLRYLASLPDSYFTSPHDSLLPKLLDRSKPQREANLVAPFGDLASLDGLLARRFEALLERINIGHRLAMGPIVDGLRIEAATAASEAHLALALAAALQSRPGAASHVSLDQAVVRGTALLDKVRLLRAGTNPAGLPDSYIEYTYSPKLQQGQPNNFKAQLKEFRERDLSRLATAAAAAKSAERAYDADQAAFAREMFEQGQSYQRRLSELCGTLDDDVAKCGTSNGLLYDALLEVKAAADRGEQSIQAVDRIFQQIRIEENRAAQIAKLRENHAQMVLANGERVRALDVKARENEKRLTKSKGLFGAVLSIGSGALSGGAAGPWGALAGGVIGGLGTLHGTYFENKGTSVNADIAAEKQELMDTERAQVEFNAGKEVLIDSAARVKTWLLEIPSLRINVHLASLDVMRATARVQALAREAYELRGARTKSQQIAKLDPRTDPSFRVYRNTLVRNAQLALDEVLRQLFIVTRSFEYEMNVSYGPRAQLFALDNPADIETYLRAMEREYDSDVSRLGTWQDRVDTFSLRDHIFRTRPLKDEKTGTSYDAADHFRRVLADPRNRDGQGNLRLEFTLSLAPNEAIFNPRFCSDKITTITASLVGAGLGAVQPEMVLEQRGTAYLRSCREKDGSGGYAIREYGLENSLGKRRVVLQAGVNLAGPTDPKIMLLRNGELQGRPISAHYELTIDRKDPANASLDLTKLDDIVLFLSHETRTVQ